MGGPRYAARNALGMACGQKSYKILQKISGKSKNLYNPYFIKYIALWAGL